jgi:replicative DNA helicase
MLALCVQRYDFLLSSVELLQPDYFEDKVLIWTFQVLRDYHQDYGTSPTQSVIENELLKVVASGRVKPQDEPLYRDVIRQLNNPVSAQSYMINEVVRFCRRTAMRNLWVSNAKNLETAADDFWDDIVSQTQEVATIGTSFLDVGTRYFLEHSERLQRRLVGEEKLRIPTGVTELDYKIGGGLKAGQLGIWMGGTSIGKSIALPHCGKRAIINGNKVVHYTLELDEDDIAERYDSSWSSVPIHELQGDTTIVRKRLKQLYTKYGDSLVIKHYPTGTATVVTIKSHLMMLEGMGFIPDLIVVDYGDLLKPLTNYDSEYADLGAIFKDLRGLAGERNVPLWTATQVNRPGLNMEIVDLEHTSDSLKKVMIADIVITICATREEIEDNTLRLFGAKNRNGPPKFEVGIRTAYDRMCFYRPGLPPVPKITGSAPPATKKKSRRKSKTV